MSVTIQEITHEQFVRNRCLNCKNCTSIDKIHMRTMGWDPEGNSPSLLL